MVNTLLQVGSVIFAVVFFVLLLGRMLVPARPQQTTSASSVHTPRLPLVVRILLWVVLVGIAAYPLALVFVYVVMRLEGGMFGPFGK